MQILILCFCAANDDLPDMLSCFAYLRALNNINSSLKNIIFIHGKHLLDIHKRNYIIQPIREV